MIAGAGPRMRDTILRSLFWAGVVGVSVASLLPRDALPPIAFVIWDKLEHVVAYAALAALGWLAYPARRNLAAIFLGLVMLGGGLELLQTHVPNREATIGDAIANTLGVGLGLALVRFGRRVRGVGDG